MKNTYLNELSLTSICLFCENADENGIISINCTQCYPNKLKFVMGDNKWTKERAEMIVNRAKSSIEKPTFQCWKCGRILPISERTGSAYMSNPPKYACKECEGIKPENPTIEQNAGENRIEGGVLSLSVAPKELNKHKEKFSEQCEKHYRPFKNCDELVECWKQKMHLVYIKDKRDKLDRPTIWIYHKKDYTERLIVTFGEGFVKVGSKTKPVSLQDLFTDYTFLDGSVCAVEE